MNSNEKPQPDQLPEKGTLYIDIDGVILPYYDERDVNQPPSQDLEKRWVSRDEFYYPEVVDALARTPAMKVLSSSRSLSFFFNSGYGTINEALNFAGSLSIDTFRPGHIPYKLRAVAKHWQQQSPVSWSTQQREDTRAVGPKAVWIDDHAWVERDSELAEHPLLADPHFLVIRPLGKIGLTLEQVQQVETFLDE